jgi:hypothetical protein
MPLTTLTVTRYITPLREGGSVPALVEASNDGTYVMKLRGAAQGAKALLADLLGTQLARALGLPVADVVLLDLSDGIARMEGDTEIQELLRRSVGLNLGVDWLPGSVGFDPAMQRPVDALLASQVVWLDALLGNVDRTARNTNMLWWHGRLWLIDQGAALTFHHQWENVASLTPSLPGGGRHALLSRATRLPEAHAVLQPRVTRALLESLVAELPDSWLLGEPAFPDAAAHRAAYVDALWARTLAMERLTQEAQRVRTAAL